MGPSCRWVYSSSFSSFGCALGIVGFITVLPGFRGASWVSSCSFWLVGCIEVHPGDRSGRWAQWGTPWGSSGSSAVAGFSALCPMRCRVRSGSLGSVGGALGCLRVGSVSLVSVGCDLGVVGFVRGA